MDIISLLLTKKHEELLSEELRRAVICDFIIKGVESNSGYFTPCIKFKGKIHKYVECYSLRDSPLPFFSGVACIIRYEPSLFLYVIWNDECLYDIVAVRENFTEHNIRITVINWEDHPINFLKWGLEGVNVISKSQIAMSIKYEGNISSWNLYQNRSVTPR